MKGIFGVSDYSRELNGAMYIQLLAMGLLIRPRTSIKSKK